MAAREEKFRHAALAYATYGAVYLAGALYLAVTGGSPRTAQAGAWLWFAVGGAILVLFPYLLWRGFTWFARLLVVLMAYRAWELLRLALSPGPDAVMLPGGGAIPVAYGAAAFCLLTVLAGA
ncbi:MAG: hypothetical protein ACE147_05650, partial [Candidatus Methylomirabilales bacterium]